MMPNLRREVPCRIVNRSLVLGRVAHASLAALLIVPLAGFIARPRRTIGYFESKADIAKITVLKYAREAYPQWATAHPDKVCPARLIELNELMNNKDVIDPWGNAYRMYCDRYAGVVVQSIGADGLAGTPDDHWSH